MSEIKDVGMEGGENKGESRKGGKGKKGGNVRNVRKDTAKMAVIQTAKI